MRHRNGNVSVWRARDLAGREEYSAPGCRLTPVPAAPFAHRRRIVWGDSDPAGIAYTGRIAVFALEAIEAWWAERLGVSWFASQRRGIGAPFVHMDLDFRTPLYPDVELSTTVQLDAIGRHSITTRVTGRLDGGELAFEGRFVQVFVAPDLAKRAVPEELARPLASELAIPPG